MFQNIIRPMIRKMGIDVVRHGPDRRFAPTLRARWIKDVNTNLVLDVGANVGDYVHELRQHDYHGRIVSFEPASPTFKKLEDRARGDANWTVRHAAAGPRNTRMTFNISHNTVSSSLLPMHEHHKAAAPDSIYEGQEEVDVITLDSLIGNVIRPEDRVWLKMDAQGYEFSILEGTKALLPQIVGMECEISVVQLYDGTPLIDEALRRIKAMGLRLVMIDELFCDPNSKFVLAVDGIFVREEAIGGT